MKIFRKFSLVIAVLLTFALQAAADWQHTGNVIRVTQPASNRVVLDTSSRARISVEFFDINVIRIRLAPSGEFERDLSYAIDRSFDRKTPLVKVTQTARDLTLTNTFGTRAVIERAPFAFKVFDRYGALVVQSTPRSASFDRSTGEVRAEFLRSSETETYYGFGEKAFAEMSRNGKFIVNWNTDTFSYPVGTDPIYQSVPFFIALHGGKAYGLYFNNTFRTWFDMGKSSPARYSFGADGGELDFFVFTGGDGRSPKAVLKDYAALTGKTPLPPIWALGNQQSRWSYFPESRVREIAAGFRSRQIPADVIYLDIDYMDGYRVFTWDRKRFPDPPKLISDLKADGFRTVLIIDPGIKVDEKYSVYSEGKKLGMFVRNPDGSELNRNVWPQASAFPDFTDPKAREWFGDKFRSHIDEGIAGFWTDMNEPGVFLTDRSEKPEIMHHPEKTFPYDTPHAGDGLGGTHRRYHNVYGMLMARSAFEGVRKLAPERRPFILTRAGFAGVQRYSAVWTGDNYASWDHLALTIPMLANMSVSGIPFVGADVGGFNDRPSGELYARWLQAAVLTPFLRSHSVGWAGNKEPWEYGDEFTAINRRTIELRYQFLPYIYSLFREHERSGEPVMSPLWYEFPGDTRTYLISDQFMLGSDVLVAPVVKEGMRERQIYLPAGNWIDWWSGETFDGGKQHTIKAPLDRLPIYVRAGAVIPTQPVIQHTGQMPRVPLTLNIFAGSPDEKAVTAVIYQDAGDGYGYKNLEWREVRVEHNAGGIKINRLGTFAGQEIRSVVIRGVSRDLSRVTVDGRNVEHKFDATSRQISFEIPADAAEIKFVR